jgi:UDP-glucose 4-epimerase
MKQVLVTGAYGFLGRYTALRFKQSGYFVTGMGHGKWHEEDFKAWGIDTWVESTVTFEALMNTHQKFDTIIHCAGSGSVAFSYGNPYEDFQKSVQSTLSILEYIRLQAPDCLFIYPSSPAVQGNLGDICIKEEMQNVPISPYGFHKKAAEELCLSYHKNYNVRIGIIRFFSIYGAGLQKQLLWDACMKIKNAESDVAFFGTGMETRDWIYVTDAASLIEKVASADTSFQIVNGASGVRVSIKTVLEQVRDCYGKEIEITFSNKVKEGDPQFFHADISKALNLGWVPTIELQDGIREYISFFKSYING